MAAVRCRSGASQGVVTLHESYMTLWRHQSRALAALWSIQFWFSHHWFSSDSFSHTLRATCSCFSCKSHTSKEGQAALVMRMPLAGLLLVGVSSIWEWWAEIKKLCSRVGERPVICFGPSDWGMNFEVIVKCSWNWWGGAVDLFID